MLSKSIFKANDIRGRVEGSQAEWDLEGARAIGRAYVGVFDLQGRSCVLGRDMRTSGAAFSAAFIDGVTEAGADVVDVGLVSTDALWYASGALGCPGVMFTASHNPSDYNGIKFCLEDAAPVTTNHLVALRDASLTGDAPSAATPGRVHRRDILDGYGDHLRSLVDLSVMRPLRVVVDAGNGMAGLTTSVVLGTLGLDVVGLYMDLDGTFPHHMPNPLIPENLEDARRAVRAEGADIGLVFDGDADRCFFLDEHGDVVPPSVITALIARQELSREPGGTIVVNTITSRVVAEEVLARGGSVVVSRVGHTSVKALMAEHDAVFGGEHSAHYYFREFWGADTGMLAALHVLAMLARFGGSMSAMARDVASYASSGEINSTVADVPGTLDRVASHFAGRGEVTADDGVTISGADWWVNVRGSNTEPLLRLNVESRRTNEMASLRDEALSIIREGSGDHE